MGGPGGPSQPSPTGKGDSRSGGETFPLTFPYGEGGSPQARRMRGAAEVTGWKYVRSKGAVRKVCRCEPVTDVTGVAAPRLDGNSLVLRPRCLKIWGIATPACALVRNDRAFSNSPLTAPSTNHSRSLRPSSVSLTRASSPGGEAPAPRSPLDKIEQMCYTMVEK